jgi:hypothetical protein
MPLGHALTVVASSQGSSLLIRRRISWWWEGVLDTRGAKDAMADLAVMFANEVSTERNIAVIACNSNGTDYAVIVERRGLFSTPTGSELERASSSF